MYFACPSVAPQVGGIPEVVQDRNSGLLMPFGDSEKMARAVESLIQDAALRTTLGRAAQARAHDKFSARVIVPRYEALYRSVCGSWSSSDQSRLSVNHSRQIVEGEAPSDAGG